MKRLLAIILSALIVIAGVCPAVAASTSDTLTISASKATGERGETVTVTLSVENNPGYAALLLTIPETKGFELVSAVSGSGMGSFTQKKNMLWDSANNITKTGTLVTLTFRIGEDAEAGENTVRVNVIECHNDALNKVKFVSENIVITVLGDPLPTTETETTAEIETTPVTESETTSATESDTADVSEGETTVVTESDTADVSEGETTVATESDTADASESENSFVTEETYDGVNESETNTVTESETDKATESEPEADYGDLLKIIPTKATGKRGETVTVSLDIKNNPGYAVLVITVLQAKGIELVNVENGEDVGNITKGTNLVWDSIDNVTKTGTLVTLTFKITSEADIGNNTIEIKARECVNADYESVDIEIDPIVITVSEDGSSNSDLNDNLNGCAGCEGYAGISVFAVTLLAAAWFTFRKKDEI